MYLKIDDYGIIGDMQAVALVSKYGSLDYCCMPHIDSPTVFAELLDKKREAPPSQKLGEGNIVI